MGAPTRARFLRKQQTPAMVGIGVLASCAVAIPVAATLGRVFDTGEWMSPLDAARDLVQGSAELVPAYGIGAGIAIVAVGAIAGAVAFGVRKLGPTRAWVDAAAPHMASAKDVRPLTQKALDKSVVRFDIDPKEYRGLPLGRLVGAGIWLYDLMEDVGLIFAGPRVGKSSSYGVPFLNVAPGAALATENKRTLHDATRGIREKLGRVFCFDPQQIVGEAPTWWWNPLSIITNESEAAELASLFGKAEKEAVSATANGNFFDQRAEALLRGLFLAAAMSEGRYYLRDVQRWLSEPANERPEPITVLEQTQYREIVNELVGIFTAAPDERSGVFSTAQVMTKSLTDRQIAEWVNPQDGDDYRAGAGRTHFEPARFHDGSNTLYSLSKDGEGSAKALVTALTVAVCTAAEKKAERLPGGRLQVPFVVVLDEAANVCRWPNLPKLYSHYGSRLIKVVTILQSYPQGESVWGKQGMEALANAANWTVYAGGNKPGQLLTQLSDAVGDYYYTTAGSPGSKNSPAGPRQEHRDRVLDVAELAALPRGRAVLLTSGNRPALIQTVPWMATPHKEAVEESLRTWDPAAERTLREAEESAARLQRDPNTVPEAAA